MNTKLMALAALVSGLLIANVQELAAQTTAHPTPRQRGRRRRRRRKLRPQRQRAGYHRQTTANHQDPTVKKMNEDESKRLTPRANNPDAGQLAGSS